MAAHLLSVVLPTHNRPERLERAARSVLAQEGAELELLIVDDASSDRTPEVTESLADDPRVRLLCNPESLGPGAAATVASRPHVATSSASATTTTPGCRARRRSFSSASTPTPKSGWSRRGTGWSMTGPGGRRCSRDR